MELIYFFIFKLPEIIKPSVTNNQTMCPFTLNLVPKGTVLGLVKNFVDFRAF